MFIVPLLLAFTLFFLFLRFGAELLIKRDKIKRSENAIIVLLMGSVGDRSLGAADLYSAGKANKIIIAESHSPGFDLLRERNISVKDIAERSKDILVDLGVNKKDIVILPGDTQNTKDEAFAVRKYVDIKSNKVGSIILVTSKYHSFRSKLIFQQVFNKYNIPIYSSPTDYDSFFTKSWYSKRLNAKRVVNEYLKLIYFLLIELVQVRRRN